VTSLSIPGKDNTICRPGIGRLEKGDPKEATSIATEELKKDEKSFITGDEDMGRPRKIRPADLQLPPNALDVFGDLQEDEQALFITEMFQALVEMKQKNDLRSLQNVVESWWQSLILRREQENPVNGSIVTNINKNEAALS